MWNEGMIDGYEFQVKHYEEASKYGIDGGRISKLWIAKDGVEQASYERGWNKQPETAEVKKVYKELIKRYN